MRTTDPLTVVDLFAGCGGLSLGLELVGFEPILVAELSKSARDTYLENRLDLDATRVVTDVRGLSRGSRRQLRAVAKLAPGEYPTLLSGGPPCQGFSGIGHRRTNSDVEKREIASNHLYQDMVRIIGKLQPHFFLFENVRGLLSARWHRDKPGKVWDTIRKHFIRQLSGEYAIAFETVHGYQYGVPQNRPRVLMFGIHRRHWSHFGLDARTVVDLHSALGCGEARGISSGLLPKPYEWKGFAPHPTELLNDLVDPHWERRKGPGGKRICPTYPAAATTAWQKAMRPDASSWGKGLPLDNHEFSKHSVPVMKRFEEAQRSVDLQAPLEKRTKKFAQRALPEKWEAPPNITVASLPDDFVHYKNRRSFTVREWARLQGFPDSYKFLGPRTTGGHRRAGDVRSVDSVRETPRYTQIGNAVPVQLAAALGWHIRRLLGVPRTVSQGPRWNTPLSEHLRSHFVGRDETSG